MFDTSRANFGDITDGITEHQKEAIDKAMSGRIGCLTGGPGCGKTYTVGRLLQKYNGVVKAVCPTGKAAIRLTESMNNAGIPITATTIHSALEPLPFEDDEGNVSFGFTKSASNPLACDMLIGDEFSMVDVSLCSYLFEAIKTGTRVLLVGDPNQLSPVGAGRPFADLVESGAVPVGHLTEPHRFSGRIGQVCKAIREDMSWEPSRELDLEADFPENFRHLETEYGIRSCLGVIDRMIERGFHPIEDQQVIVSQNEKGSVSRKLMNEQLQSHLNKDGFRISDCRLRVGDKVIHLKNGMFPSASPEEFYAMGFQPTQDSKTGRMEHNVYVANGEIGIVENIVESGSRHHLHVRYPNIPLVRYIAADRPLEGKLDLAYAVTGHKMQGSQSKICIEMICDSHAALRTCSRSWWYTSLSRASMATVTIGRMATLRKHCRRVDLESRKTLLKEDLQEALGGWQRVQSS